jgi:hypothetical protein
MLHVKTGPYWLQHKGLDIGVWRIFIRLEKKSLKLTSLFKNHSINCSSNSSYTGTLTLLTGSWLCTSWEPVHCWLQGAHEFSRCINMPVGWLRSEWSRYNSQITGGVENAVDILHTGRRSSNLPFEAVLQEYLQFSYNIFFLVLPFRGYCCKLCTSNNPRWKIHKHYIWGLLL